MSGNHDRAVTMSFRTGSATTGNNDYIAKTGNLTFAAGQTSKTFTVAIKGDKRKEGDESFYVLLSGPSSNAIIDNAYGWGTILDDDLANGKG